MTQERTQANSTTYNGDDEDESWESKERYVQREWEENRGWESGSKQGRRICHWELLIRRPINQFFQQQIIQSSLPMLCLSTPAIFSKHTHLFLSLFKVLQLGFTETFDLNFFFFFFWETNTQKEEEKEVLTQSHTTTLLKSYGKVTDKVLVRCIFIPSRT